MTPPEEEQTLVDVGPSSHPSPPAPPGPPPLPPGEPHAFLPPQTPPPSSSAQIDLLSGEAVKARHSVVPLSLSLADALPKRFRPPKHLVLRFGPAKIYIVKEGKRPPAVGRHFAS